MDRLKVAETVNNKIAFMKRLFLVAAIAVLGTATVIAQPKQVQEVQAAGDFNNGTSTAWKTWKISAYPLVTTSRTITLSTRDTATERVRSEVNRQTYVMVVDSLGGKVDSCTVTFQASVDSGSAVDYVTLQTFTCANQGKNVFKYELTGNPYASYRVLFRIDNRHAGSSARIKSKLLVRYKEPEDWEVLVSSWIDDRTSRRWQY